MVDNWMDKTCVSCYFKDEDNKCRRFPPICWGCGMQYPNIENGILKDKYMSACAEYKES